MPAAWTRLIIRWLVGAAVGTLLIAVTSPLFLRSYLPLSIDPVRGVWTLPAGHAYRWRSEGYATTRIGPLGMPGRTGLATESGGSNSTGATNSTGESADNMIRVALWGDSQAEGVCLADDQKLFAQIERASDGRCVVYPLARSGEDASVWLTQMPAIESELSIDLHVMLVVDLPDLLSAPLAPLPRPDDPAINRQAAIAGRLPAFVIESARNLLFEADRATPRRLRFSVGPTPRRSPRKTRSAPLPDWPGAIDAIADTADRPVVIVHAPLAPQIVSGRVTRDIQIDEYRAMRRAALGAGLTVIDMSEPFDVSAREGVWPHGYHNGYIGVGHLNRSGYAIIADRVVEAIDRLDVEH